MAFKAYAAALGAAVIAVAAVAVSSVEAQTQMQTQAQTQAKKSPRARVTVAPRSFLDAGTEVLPGERKFTDYAYPPGWSGSTGQVSNTGGEGRLGPGAVHAALPAAGLHPLVALYTNASAEGDDGVYAGRILKGAKPTDLIGLPCQAGARLVSQPSSA